MFYCIECIEAYLNCDFYEDNGVFIECARDLLLNCCYLALKEYTHEGKIREEEYKQLITTTNRVFLYFQKHLTTGLKYANYGLTMCVQTDLGVFWEEIPVK